MEKLTELEDFLTGIQEKKKYPKGLQLDLSHNEVGGENIEIFLDAWTFYHAD